MSEQHLAEKDEKSLPSGVNGVLAQIDRRWRATGLPRRDRRDLLTDVEADLVAAGAEMDTDDPHALLGTDVDAFADEVVRERGLQRPRGRYGRLMVFSAIGAVVAVIGIWPLLLGVMGAVTSEPTPEPVYSPPGTTPPPPSVITEEATTGGTVFIFSLYALAGVLFVGLVLLAVNFGLRSADRLGATLRRMALLMPLSAVVSLPLAVLVARTSGYSTEASVVLFEAAIVLACAAAAVLASRYWVVRAA
ncbi:hypothetical protein MO973_45200 [Paenibacillus sp. TRM 82003]|uniref:hypothetical protein n=1 Tax=Kineococcus sp. TRM81007 TaxID=2925831 RepID=UPI001F594413|nr:hypothetical protein [Kineococcus sp. TRM81007]MCI2240431.1 hypothetical protein [Kineococcus sp. TRM81007]MCI3927393.1 hypothetical protein [Paenibacillus sp. TRM 82003]